MSTMFEKVVNTSRRKNYKFTVEQFNSAMEVAKTCKEREITNSRFENKQDERFGRWEGVKTYDEALEYLRNGHQETVDRMKEKIKVNVSGQTKRFRFQNSPQGFNPIVPLALKGVPNCMIDMRMVPIKSKVIDVYYDMTCASGIDSDDIIEAGRKILTTIYELEAQGYRFNLYAVQTYTDSNDADMLVIKVKSSTQPVDLKRISFPLCHTAFFRVIGFDWYSRFPKGKYRSGYGCALKYQFESETEECAKQLFGRNAVFFAAASVVRNNEEYIKGVLTNESNDR